MYKIMDCASLHGSYCSGLREQIHFLLQQEQLGLGIKTQIVLSSKWSIKSFKGQILGCLFFSELFWFYFGIFLYFFLDHLNIDLHIDTHFEKYQTIPSHNSSLFAVQGGYHRLSL